MFHPHFAFRLLQILPLLCSFVAPSVAQSAPGSSFPNLITFHDNTPTISARTRDAGDINGDGIGDFILSQKNLYAPGGAAMIAASLQPGGLPIDAPEEDVIISGADGSVLVDLRASATTTLLGSRVHALADLDQDGCDEYLLVAPSGFGTTALIQIYSGATQLVLGSYTRSGVMSYEVESVRPFGDLDGDGVGEFGIIDRSDLGGGVTSSRLEVRGAFGSQLLMTLNPAGRRLGSTGILGDLDGDGVSEFFLSSVEEPAATAPLTAGRINIYSGASFLNLGALSDGNPLSNFGLRAIACRDRDGDGVGDLVVLYREFSTGPPPFSGLLVVSSLTGAILGQLAADFSAVFDDIRSAGDANGDGYADYELTQTSALAPSRQLRSGREGAFIDYGHEVNQLTGPTAASLRIDFLGDLNGDLIADRSNVIIDANNGFALTCNTFAVMGAQPYGVGTGSRILEYRPFLHEPRQGAIVLSGASPNASLLVAASALSQGTGTIFGTSFPLHISLDPLFLLGMSMATADAAGEFQLPVELDFPSLALMSIYLQVAELGPNPNVSNGLALRFGF